MTSIRLRPGSPSMRWVLTLAVILAPTGCALAMAGRAAGNDALSWAQMLPPLCTVAVCWLSFVRPRPLNGTIGQPLDEREIIQRLNAYIRGLAVVNTITIFGIGYLYFAADFGWRTPSGRDDWGCLLSTFVCWSFGMPLLFANWQNHPLLDDDDDQP